MNCTSCKEYLSVINFVFKNYLFYFWQQIGEFLLTERDIRCKPRGKIYSLHEGYEQYWDPAVKEYIRSKKHPEVNIFFTKVYSNNLIIKGIPRPANPTFWREECDNLFGGVFSDLVESSVRAIKQNRLFAVIVTLTLSLF